MSTSLPDARYTARMEGTGNPDKPWVARFLGAWLGAFATQEEATACAKRAYATRVVGTDCSAVEPPPAPLGLGDKIQGGTIIAWRQTAAADRASAIVLTHPRAAQPYVVVDLPTDRHVTSWPSGTYFSDIARAVAAYQRG